MGEKYTRREGFHSASVAKNSPAKQEMQFYSLSQKDPLDKEMETHSSFFFIIN